MPLLPGLPGGANLVAGTGGYLQLWSWLVSSSGLPAINNWRALDVAFWRLHKNRISPQFWGSGTWGAIRRRVVAQDWEIFVRVWWDSGNPPDLALIEGECLAIKLMIGDPTWWNGSSYLRPINYYNGQQTTPAGAINAETNHVFVPCYVAPMAQLGSQIATCSSEGNEADGMVFQDWVIQGDSLLWFMNNIQGATPYSTYLLDLVAQGLIPSG